MNLINLTQHNITVKTSDGIINIKPSGEVARIVNTQTLSYIANGIPVVKNSYTSIVGLPQEKKDTVYIVSGLVRRFLTITEKEGARSDVVAPETEIGCARDKDGKTLYVTRLVCN